MITGRYAPSPSGRMHLGNLMCCLLAWLSAKSKGGQVLLRIEDLDTQRCPRAYADAIIDDLAWLGLAADGPEPPIYQSERSAIYQQYFDELARRGLVYPCFCSRSQLHAASAPHRSDGQVVYAGTCRGLTPAEIAARTKTRAPAWRVQVPDEVIAFEDGHMGHYAENLARDCGDFYLRRADGVFAYQLAVVVDDALMGVDEVVRGSDLLSSTPRQLWLYRELGLTAPKFREEMGPGCHERCAGIAARLKPMLEGMAHVRFLDANTLPGAGCSDVDGMHMTLEAHKVLAEALQKELTGSTL